MNRPSEKLLREMSSEELALESNWHENEAGKIFDEIREIRERALKMDEQTAFAMLESAVAKEAEAQAHVNQSNILNSLIAARLPASGVGEAHRAASK